MMKSHRIEGFERLPSKWAICETCRGSGGSSAYLGDWTGHEFQEAFSPDEAEEYFGGAYDRPCADCEGSGKVLIVDEARCSPSELKAWHDHCREEAYWRAQEATERRFGA